MAHLNPNIGQGTPPLTTHPPPPRPHPSGLNPHHSWKNHGLPLVKEPFKSDGDVKRESEAAKNEKVNWLTGFPSFGYNGLLISASYFCNFWYEQYLRKS